MNRTEFIRGLIDHVINPDIVNFNNNTWKDGYCVRKNYFGGKCLHEIEEKSMEQWDIHRKAML